VKENAKNKQKVSWLPEKICMNFNDRILWEQKSSDNTA